MNNQLYNETGTPVYTVTRLCSETGYKPRTALRRIHSGKLLAVKVGQQYFCTKEAFNACIQPYTLAE